MEFGDGFSAVFGDVDNDGWLRVRLTGANGDAGGIGAKVWIYEAGHLGKTDHLRGYQQAINSRAYLVQHSPVLHFGLEDAPSVDVRVEFPSGKIIERQRVPSRSLIHIDGRE